MDAVANDQSNDSKPKKPTLSSHSTFVNTFTYLHVTNNKVKSHLNHSENVSAWKLQLHDRIAEIVSKVHTT